MGASSFLVSYACYRGFFQISFIAYYILSSVIEKAKDVHIGGGIYDIWYPNPKKIATKGFSTDLISVGCQY